MNLFIKNPNLTKQKKFWRVGGEGSGGVARVSDFFFQKNPSLKFFFFYFFFCFEGVKVREDWLV